MQKKGTLKRVPFFYVRAISVFLKSMSKDSDPLSLGGRGEACLPVGRGEGESRPVIPRSRQVTRNLILSVIPAISRYLD
jgi:hypothetical protein